MKECLQCGHKNPENAHFCEECGNAFKMDDLNETIELKKESSENNSTNKQFCPNCGTIIPPDSQFCTSCGYALKDTLGPIRPVKRSLSKKQKNGLIAGLLLLVLFVGGFLFGRYYYSYPQQLDRFEQVFETQDPSKIAEIVTSEDPNYKVSAGNLKKFISYYQADSHKKDFSEFLADLKNDPSQLADFSVQEKGRFWGLFPRYQLVIQPVYLMIATDQADMELLLDNKKLATSKGHDYQTTWGPLTPGNYQVIGKLDNEKAVATQQLIRYHNPKFETDSHVTINLHKISFKVTSNIDGAKVLLNDKEVGTIQNGQAEIKDVVWHQGLAVQLAYETANDQLKTDTYQLSADEYLADNYDADSYASEISLDFDAIQTKADVQSYLDDLYSELSSYTSTYSDFETTERRDLAEYFVNGLDNTDEKDFEKFINDIKTSDKKLRVDAQAKVETVSLTGKNTYTVQYLIYYDTIYKDDTPDVNQVFRYKKATLYYNEDEAKFQIDNLGGVENFETVDSGDA